MLLGIHEKVTSEARFPGNTTSLPLTLRDIPAGDHLLKTEKTPHSLLKRDSELPTFPFLLFPPDQLRQILNPICLPTPLKSKASKARNRKTACPSQGSRLCEPNPGKISISSRGSGFHINFRGTNIFPVPLLQLCSSAGGKEEHRPICWSGRKETEIEGREFLSLVWQADEE